MSPQDHHPRYVIKDHRTGKAVSKPYGYAQRNKARDRADRMDNEWGAHRYSAMPIYGEG